MREAVFDTIDFWAKKGTDGFRVCRKSSSLFCLKLILFVKLQFDVINLVSKVPGLPDAPIKNPDKAEQPAIEMFTNGY